jgi:hypothetical protein
MDMGKEKKKFEKMVIPIGTMKEMRDALDVLHSLGYREKQGLPLGNVWIHEEEFMRGIRAINIYENKIVAFSSKCNKGFKVVELSYIKELN